MNNAPDTCCTPGALPRTVVRRVSELADILGDCSTVTCSGLPVTVVELIDVQQGAARELRDIIEDYSQPDPGMFLIDRQAFIGVLASLSAAISLLEAGGKKATASDTMFDAMLQDYKNALEIGRTAYTADKT